MKEALEFAAAAMRVGRRIAPPGDETARREFHLALAGWLCSLSLNAPTVAVALKGAGATQAPDLVASTYARLVAGEHVYGERLIRDRVARARVPVEEQKALARAVR